MLRHSRVNTIIALLQQGPQTIESLQHQFDGKVSPRQIRGDIELIKSLGYGDSQTFEKTGPANRKTWQIDIPPYEQNTLRLAQGVLPQVFNVKRHEVLQQLTSWATDEMGSVIESTHFYETVAKEQLDKNLEAVIQAIDAEKKLSITGMSGDATSIGNLVEFPITVLPVKILYHRGCFCVAAVADITEQVLTFQVDQIQFCVIADSFCRAELIDAVDDDLANRFGISQNMDGMSYDIELRFSSITGEFVSRQFWHNSQSGRPDGDEWVITFQCGINRELVGWLFQWMSNVRVIGPPQLKERYDDQLNRMLIVQQRPANKPLNYTNQFAPVVG